MKIAQVIELRESSRFRRYRRRLWTWAAPTLVFGLGAGWELAQVHWGAGVVLGVFAALGAVGIGAGIRDGVREARLARITRARHQRRTTTA